MLYGRNKICTENFILRYNKVNAEIFCWWNFAHASQLCSEIFDAVLCSLFSCIQKYLMCGDSVTDSMIPNNKIPVICLSHLKSVWLHGMIMFRITWWLTYGLIYPFIDMTDNWYWTLFGTHIFWNDNMLIIFRNKIDHCNIVPGENTL